MKRRSFIKTGGITLMTGLISNHVIAAEDNAAEHSEIDWNFEGKEIKPNDEEIWQKIGSIYPRSSTYIQLENGYFSHQALPVLDYHQKIASKINEAHSVFMRLEQEAALERARTGFANYQACSEKEIAFTRNTTESLNTVIMGFPWNAGDEVVIGNQDYGSMVEAFEQVRNRWKIDIKLANIPIHDFPDWENRCVEAYLKLITPKTVMVHLTHPINLNGQGIPLNTLIHRIRQINKDICIVVDAAHALSHFPETIGSINADVIGSSLHKWTGAPLGLGCLYIRSNYIGKIWPLMGDTGRPIDDIRKFEHQGTRPIQTIISLEKAIEINKRIGLKNRRNRLRYLKYVWQGNKKALKELSVHLKFTLDSKLMNSINDFTSTDNIIFLHPLEQTKYQGAISTFQVKGLTPNELAKELKETYGIFTVAINHTVINGVRITPQLSNSVKDLMYLNESIGKILNK